MNPVSSIRETEIEMHCLRNMDYIYKFYYDETNNIRKLRIKGAKLNVENPDCFVLGGLVCEGDRKAIDVANLSSDFGIQSNAKEVKLKHLAKGDFLKVLTSKKVGAYLRWIDQSELWIHFHILDPLYWSIVDTVDSMIGASKAHHLFSIQRELKSTLYEVICSELETSIPLLHRYEYPDVKPENRSEFLIDLHELVKTSPVIEHFERQMLLGLIGMAKSGEPLEFIEGFIANDLIDSFSVFYARNIRMYENSIHIFDNEDSVKQEFVSGKLDGCINPATKYEFVDSQSEIMVQMSDIIVGLLGKYFTYLKVTSFENVVKAVLACDSQQLKNISSLCRLIKRSEDQSNGFSHFVTSGSLLHKHTWIMKMFSRNE